MRRLVLVGAVAAAPVAAKVFAGYRDLLDQVAPDLRKFYLPLTTFGGTSARTLWLFRLPFRVEAKPQDGVVVTTRRLPHGSSNTRAVILTPDGVEPGAPAVLWLHGGALVVGSPEFETFAAAPLARELGCVIVVPRYGLAPEEPFPAGLDDCMAALAWMHERGNEIGIDPDRIAVVGGSAGGGLAAAMAQRCHDEGIPLRAQVLKYPMLDDQTVLRKENLDRRWIMNTPGSIRFGWTAYLGHDPSSSAERPTYAVPARRTDLTGLAPAWVGVGDLDLFCAESVAYAERLQESGVPCELVVVPGMYHGADGLIPQAPSMVEYFTSMVDFLRLHLS